MLQFPVNIVSNAVIAAGSVVTKNISEPDIVEILQKKL